MKPKEHQMLYTPEMALARRLGQKTQTRRTRGLKKINEHPNNWMLHSILQNTNKKCVAAKFISGNNETSIINCPYGMPGDMLWPREAFQLCNACGRLNFRSIHPKRCHGCDSALGKWRSSLHLNREYVTSLDEILAIHIERVQNISDEDAKAEGSYHWWGSLTYSHAAAHQCTCHRDAYMHLFESINGPGSWEANPWVWVIEFRVINP